MFKARRSTKESLLLKALQEVQTKIKSHTATIAALKPPIPQTLQINKDVREILNDALLLENMELFINHVQYKKENAWAYLENLGRYLVAASEYRKNTLQYEKELHDLKITEAHIKKELGID